MKQILAILAMVAVCFGALGQTTYKGNFSGNGGGLTNVGTLTKANFWVATNGSDSNPGTSPIYPLFTVTNGLTLASNAVGLGRPSVFIGSGTFSIPQIDLTNVAIIGSGIGQTVLSLNLGPGGQQGVRIIGDNVYIQDLTVSSNYIATGSSDLCFPVMFSAGTNFEMFRCSVIGDSDCFFGNGSGKRIVGLFTGKIHYCAIYSGWDSLNCGAQGAGTNSFLAFENNDVYINFDINFGAQTARGFTIQGFNGKVANNSFYITDTNNIAGSMYGIENAGTSILTNGNNSYYFNTTVAHAGIHVNGGTITNLVGVDPAQVLVSSGTIKYATNQFAALLGDGSGLTNLQAGQLTNVPPSMHLGLVDNPGRIPKQNSGGGNNTQNTQVKCIAPFPITNLLFGLPNFYDTQEGGTGGNATVAFSIEYPIGTLPTAGVFGGTNSATYCNFDPTRTNVLGIATNASFVVGEVRLSTPIPTGATYNYRVWYSNSVSGSAISVTRNCRTDDSLSFSINSDTNKTITTGTYGSTGQTQNTFYDPFFLAALTSKVTVALIGGSREYGISEVRDGNLHSLYGQNRLYIDHSCGNLGVAGTSASQFSSFHTNRLAAAQLAQAIVLGGFPINSIKNDGFTGAQTITAMGAVAALFTNLPVYCETIIAKPSSSDGFSTIANQSADSDFAQENIFNYGLMLGNVTNIKFAININPAIETSQFSGFFLTDGVTNDTTAEGPFYPRIASYFGCDPLSAGFTQGAFANYANSLNPATSSNSFKYFGQPPNAVGFSVISSPFNSAILPASPGTTTNAWTFWGNPTNGVLYAVATNAAGGVFAQPLTIGAGTSLSGTTVHSSPTITATTFTANVTNTNTSGYPQYVWCNEVVTSVASVGATGFNLITTGTGATTNYGTEGTTAFSIAMPSTNVTLSAWVANGGTYEFSNFTTVGTATLKPGQVIQY